VKFIFDVDGVVLDSIPAYQRAWAAWALEHRISEEAIWAAAHGRRPVDIIRSVGGGLDVTTASKRFESLIQAQYQTVEAHDGAHGLLTTLPGSRWTVATSGGQGWVEAAFRRLRLPAPYRGVYGADITRGKPDPACFLLAADRLETSPADCVVVEDSPSGVAAGKAAGMTVMAVTTTHIAGDLHQADSIHRSLAEAAGLIYSLSGLENDG
jgi:mannitol-1-/sugar-/sorbitol-6-phosphatase